MTFILKQVSPFCIPYPCRPTMIYHTFLDLFLNAKRFRSLNFLDLPVVSGWVSTTRESIWKGVGALQSEFVWGGLCMCYTWVLGLKEVHRLLEIHDFFGFQNRRSGRSFWRLGLNCCGKGKADKNVWGSITRSSWKIIPTFTAIIFVDVFPLERARISLLLYFGF